MNNYTRLEVRDASTGEFVADLCQQERKRFYSGPRKYWRIMKLYDEALLHLSSKVGIHLITHLKDNADKSYKVLLNATWLAEDFNSSRESVSRNIKKLINIDVIKKLPRQMYFINPNLFWIQGITDKEWKEIEEFYKAQEGEK